LQEKGVPVIPLEADRIGRGAGAGDEPEVVAGYRAARETAERAELGEASRAEVEQAVHDLRTVLDDLLGG
jgi:hypothetical protein